MKRFFYILAILLPAIFATLFFLTSVLGVAVNDPLIEGLGIEALGAIMTAALVVFFEREFSRFLDRDSGERDTQAELRELREEIRRLRNQLGGSASPPRKP